MKVPQVCADCGVGLSSLKFSEQCPLCYDCKRRLISDVNAPGMDRAISLVLFALAVAGVVWLVF